MYSSAVPHKISKYLGSWQLLGRPSPLILFAECLALEFDTRCSSLRGDLPCICPVSFVPSIPCVVSEPFSFDSLANGFFSCLCFRTSFEAGAIDLGVFLILVGSVWRNEDPGRLNVNMISSSSSCCCNNDNDEHSTLFALHGDI